MVLCIMVSKMTGGCKMCWSFFCIGHRKGPHDGVGVVIKTFFHRKQLNAHGHKLQNAKEVVMFLQEHLSSRPKHIVVHANHSKESFCMFELKMWIGRLSYLCVILSKWPWKSTLSICLTKKTSHSCLLEVWHVFVNFVSIVLGLNVLMSSG